MSNKNNPPYIFFGTSRFSVFVLDELKARGFLPALVVTTPDAPKGRGLALTPPPVKVWAREQGIPFLQPETFTDEFSRKLQAAKCKLAIVASYGKIIPKAVLDILERGVLNVHPSLLPLYRGASPIQSQILNGDDLVGVTIMLVDEKMDHGPVVAREAIPMPNPLPTTKDLEELLAVRGGAILAETMPEWIAKNINAQEQDHAIATYTRPIKKEDGLIDPRGDAPTNWRKFQALRPWPGVYFFVNGKRVKIAEAKYENGVFAIVAVTPEGKNKMAYVDFLRSQ